MTTKNNIPVGYKASAVGVIPQEWEVKQIRNLGRVITGNTPPTADSSNYGNEYMFVSPADLLDGQKYILYTEKMLSAKGYALARKIPQGSVLYTCIGSTIGKIGIASDELASNQQINAVICNDSGEFLYYALLHRTNRIKLLAGEQAVPIINKSEFEKFKLPVPPIAEQRKIAEILGVWDEAIEKQSRLIEKLELRKRALMQRLLTGRTRLSGFTTPWQKIKLSEAGIFLSTNTLSREKLNDNDGYIQNIHYGDILVKYSSIVDAQLTAIPYINNGVDISSDYLGNGDIVFSDTAEDSIVGKAIEISNIADNKIVAGLHTMLFRPNKGCYAKHYLGYYINSDAYRKQLAPLIQGIKVCSISKKAISQTVIETPSLPEQKAIAEVLTAADNEIATHRKKLDALRLQKRGLMQQLLTGKTRVKI